MGVLKETLLVYPESQQPEMGLEGDIQCISVFGSFEATLKKVSKTRIMKGLVSVLENVFENETCEV